MRRDIGAPRDHRGPRVQVGPRGEHTVQALARQRRTPRRRVPLSAGLREPGRAARHAVTCHPDARSIRAEQLRPRGQCFTNMLMLYWRSRSVPQLSDLPHHMRGTLK